MKEKYLLLYSPLHLENFQVIFVEYVFYVFISVSMCVCVCISTIYSLLLTFALFHLKNIG